MEADHLSWLRGVLLAGESRCSPERRWLYPLLAASRELTVLASGDEDYLTLGPPLVAQVRPLLDAVFLLAGQSNMSGRGDTIASSIPQELHLPNVHPGTAIAMCALKESSWGLAVKSSRSQTSFFFDPLLGWQSIVDESSLLHGNVDVMKQVGAGPGAAFALAFGGRVGVIPTAVGATALSEWMPDALNECPPSYHRGCPNLLSAALRSVFVSGCSFRLSGILWYQGENDCCTVDTFLAESYIVRFDYFISRLRTLLSLADQLFVADSISVVSTTGELVTTPPVLTCAVTSTRRLPYLELIRQQQLEVNLPNVDVVDVLGASLKLDCIHIDTRSAIALGVELARKMRLMLDGKVDDSRADCGVTAGKSTLVGYASWLDSPYDLMCSRLFSAARIEAIAAMDSTVFQGGKKLAILQSGNAPVNFVSGEVFFLDFCRVLHILPSLVDSDDKKKVFVDLGCGVGSCLAAASFLRRTETCHDVPYFSELIGFDLMHSKIVECASLLNALGRQSPWVGQAQELRAIEADFLQQDFSHADVVYACATCFDSTTMRSLEEGKFPLLRSGVLVVLIDKELSEKSSLTLLASCQVRTTWGVANARVYRK